MGRIGPASVDPWDGNVDFLRPLSALLSRMAPAEMDLRVQSVVLAVGALAIPGPPFALPDPQLPAAVELPAKLEPQILVNLLKHPFCVGAARRAVLDQLERHYGRPFADQWDFVRFAEAQHPELDLTSPPMRPRPLVVQGAQKVAD